MTDCPSANLPAARMTEPLSRTLQQGVAVVVLALLGSGCGPDRRSVPPGCVLDIGPDDQSRLALAFLIANPTASTETGQYNHPFTDFRLAISTAGNPLAVSQPAADTSTETRTLVLGPGAGVRLVPPIRLQFGHHGPKHRPASKSREIVRNDNRQLSIWTIDHRPAPITIGADIDIQGLAPRRCQADYRPPGT
ncbi:MAG: hypothetical protein MJE77_42860 [Proteobacteria bacterium]|nr:hypothetical protein [Pseudomonadota bacterium]